MKTSQRVITMHNIFVRSAHIKTHLKNTFHSFDPLNEIMSLKILKLRFTALNISYALNALHINTLPVL